MKFKLLTLVVTLPSLLAACGQAVTGNGDPNEPRAVRVTTALPQPRNIEYVLTALGSVESLYDPTVSAETSGQITKLEVSEGGAISAGQRLLEIDNTLHQIEAAKARAELKRQEVVIANQGREVERLKRLAKSQSVSQDQLEDQQDHLEMLQAQRDVAQKQWEHALHLESKTRVDAPEAGIIARRYVSLGDYVTPGQPLFDLVSVERLRARLAFPEHDASRVQRGQEVQLSSPAAPDVIAIGEVTSINPRINTVNRAVEVTVEFDNPGGWFPGASVDATLVVAEYQNALTVPLMSVVTRNNKNVVFVVHDQRVVATAISLGWRESDWVEVSSGLQSDDRIVVQGAALISEDSLISEGPALQ